MSRRFLTTILTLSVILSSLPFISSAFAADDTSGYAEDGVLKILIIGNSYAQDAGDRDYGYDGSFLMDTVSAMVKDGCKIKIGVLSAGGVTMAWHASRADDNAESYSLVTIENGSDIWGINGAISSVAALRSDNWDIVVLEPYNLEVWTGRSSVSDGILSKYRSLSASLPRMMDHVRTNCPGADLYLYEVWSWNDSNNEGTLDSGSKRFSQTISTISTAKGYTGAETGAAFKGVIPAGTAIQNARNSYLAYLEYNTDSDDKGNRSCDAQAGLSRDGVHLTFNIGRFIVSRIFAEVLVPEEIRKETYTLPSLRSSEAVGDLPSGYQTVCEEAVSYALESLSKTGNGYLQKTVLTDHLINPIVSFSDTGTISVPLFGISSDEELLESLYSYMISEYEISVLSAEVTDNSFPADGASSEVTVTMELSYGYDTLTTEKTVRLINLKEEKAPTCTDPGNREYAYDPSTETYYDNTGSEVSEDDVMLAPAGHDFTMTVTDPTCTAGGYTTYTCSVCGDSYTDDETEPLGHDYIAVITDPTCTEGGYTTYTCSRCSDSYTGNETDPLGHDYIAAVTEPTCTEGGYTSYTCSRCGDSYTGNETDPLGHDYIAAVTEPTCTERGYTTFTCSRCGDSYTGDETSPLGHDYIAAVTEPTCTEGGYTTFTCSRCGDSYTGNETDPLGHDWGEWISNNDASYGKDGTKTRICRNDPSHTETVTDPGSALIPVTFTDVREGAYYYDAVAWAVMKGITKGVSDTEFAPDNGCTRGQVVTFLYRAAGSPEISGADIPFTDVRDGAYYRDAVAWATKLEITRGTSETEFSPDDICTRGQVVTFLYRANGCPVTEGRIMDFRDVKPGAYYYDAVLWAVETGITNGTSDTTFSPDNTCSRGQIVTFLYRSVIQ